MLCEDKRTLYRTTMRFSHLVLSIRQKRSELWLSIQWALEHPAGR